ncbi:MAG: permease [Lachnospiraceae bacterium]|nr:permease [Lachnospiraceae bacterium]
MKKQIKKYWFLAAAIIANLITVIAYPLVGTNALSFTGKNFLNFLFMLTPIFICIGLMDVWIERAAMIKIMGEKSSFKGVILALLLGVVTAVPLYALLPVAGVLLKKGSRIFNVLVFLCASASIRIPLLLFEISSLGWKFTSIRFVLNLVIIFAIALIIEKTLSETDKKEIYANADKL